jgi:hypothetical protein
MPIRPFLVGSLTGAMLANAVNPAAATLTDAPWLPINSLSTIANASDLQLAASRESFKQAPDWISQIASNAQAISKLRAGWDGRGSIPISDKMLYRATTYVRLALEGLSDATAPRLVPGGDGSVQIEWHSKRGELEFDIGPAHEMTIWIRDRRNGAEFEGDNQAALALFYRWAPWIASRLRDDFDATSKRDAPLFSIAA